MNVLAVRAAELAEARPQLAAAVEPLLKARELSGGRLRTPTRGKRTSLPGRWRWCDRPRALRCSKEQNALHTLIHQRHLTPSCGGYTPTAERTLNPARMFMESMTLARN